jgi:hypothetical protein
LAAIIGESSTQGATATSNERPPNLAAAAGSNDAGPSQVVATIPTAPAVGEASQRRPDITAIFQGLHEMVMGEYNPAFLDSQDSDLEGCRYSSVEEFSEDSGDEDYRDDVQVPNLEDMVMPPELLYRFTDLCCPSRRRRPHKPPAATLGASEAIEAEATGVRHKQREEDDDEGKRGPWEDDEGVVPLGDDENGDPWEPWGEGGEPWGKDGEPWDEDGEPWGDDGVQPRADLGENRFDSGPGVHGDPRVNSKREPPVRRDRAKRTPRVPMLDVNSTYEEDENEEDQEEDGDPENPTSVRHLYRNSTWLHESFTFSPPRTEFVGSAGPSRVELRMPTILSLFRLFWPDSRLRKIITETNRYAMTPDHKGKLPRKGRWKRLSIQGLKAFFAISFYMGLKKQPNMKTYWQRKGSLFHCPVISQIFTRDRFQAITRCLHIMNPARYVTNRKEPGYDKMGQVRWLVDELRQAFMREYTLGKNFTVDEMMIRYKGSYCPARQYLPMKPCKWGIKVWCLADSSTKFVYNFDIYCGRNQVGPDVPRPIQHGEASVAHNVVLKMVEGLDGKGHVVVTDNYFSSVGLFTDLATREIYATGTMRSNRIGLPLVFKNLRTWNRSNQGTLEWRMPSSRGLSSVVWKDKRPVLLLSTHASPIQPPCLHPNCL